MPSASAIQGGAGASALSLASRITLSFFTFPARLSLSSSFLPSDVVLKYVLRAADLHCFSFPFLKRSGRARGMGDDVPMPAAFPAPRCFARHMHKMYSCAPPVDAVVRFVVDATPFF